MTLCKVCYSRWGVLWTDKGKLCQTCATTINKKIRCSFCKAFSSCAKKMEDKWLCYHCYQMMKDRNSLYKTVKIADVKIEDISDDSGLL